MIWMALEFIQTEQIIFIMLMLSNSAVLWLKPIPQLWSDTRNFYTFWWEEEYVGLLCQVKKNVSENSGEKGPVLLNSEILGQSLHLRTP